MNAPAWIKHLFTEGDNATYCPARVATATVAAIYHAAAAAAVYFGSIHIDMGALGQYLNHMAELIMGGTAAVAAKSLSKADAPKEGP